MCGYEVKMKQWIEVEDGQSVFEAAEIARNNDDKWADFSICVCGNVFIREGYHRDVISKIAKQLKRN